MESGSPYSLTFPKIPYSCPAYWYDHCDLMSHLLGIIFLLFWLPVINYSSRNIYARYERLRVAIRTKQPAKRGKKPVWNYARGSLLSLPSRDFRVCPKGEENKMQILYLRHVTRRRDPTCHRRPPSLGQLSPKGQRAYHHLQVHRRHPFILVSRALWDTTICRTMTSIYLVIPPGIARPQYDLLLALRHYSFQYSPSLLQLGSLTSTQVGWSRYTETISSETWISNLLQIFVQPTGTIKIQCARSCDLQEEGLPSHTLTWFFLLSHTWEISCFSRYSASISSESLLSILCQTSVQPTVPNNIQCARSCDLQEVELLSSTSFVEQGDQECWALDSESRSSHPTGSGLVDVLGESHRRRSWNFHFLRGSRRGPNEGVSHTLSSPPRSQKNAFIKAVRKLCCCLCIRAENE